MFMVIRKFLALVMVLCCANAQAFVEITSFSVSERDGRVDVGVTLKTSNPTPPASIIPSVYVDYTTVDGTAKDEATDGDYIKATGKLEFTKLETQFIQVEIINDLEIEDPEDFSVEATIGVAPTSVKQSNSGGNTQRKKPRIQASPTGTINIVDEDRELDVRVEFPSGSLFDVDVTLVCTSGNIDAPPLGETSQTKMTTGGVATFELLNYLPDTTCSASQTDGPPLGYEQVLTNCDAIQTNCAMVNALVGYQAIPALPGYGLLLLVLLLSGVGAVWVRRSI